MSKYFILTLAYFIFAIEASAQDSSLKLDEIINKYIKALGGKQQLQSVHSMKMTGIHSYRGLESPLTIIIMRPNFYRVEITHENRKEIAIFDGKTAWEMTGAVTREIQDPRNKIFMDINDDFEGALIGYKAKGHKVELAGIDNVDGQEAYKLHMILGNGRIEDWYIDRSSFLLLKRSTTFKRGNSEYLHDIFFMDYKKINGIMVPYYLERAYEPHYVRSYEITNVEINPELDAGLFRIESVPKSR